MKQAIIYIVYLLLCFRVSAQQPVEALIDRFETFHRNYPAEKIYIHTDKPYYAAGEHLYMAVYHVDAYDHKVLDELSFITVLLVHPDGRKVVSRKIKIDKGFTVGSVFLPDTLSSGMYELHAYTAWMSNFTSAPVFSTPIAIEGLSKVNYDDCKKFEIKFAQQMQTIIADLPSHLSFQLFDGCGRPIHSEVNMVSNSGDLLVNLKSDEFGVYSLRNFIFNNHSYLIEVPDLGRKELQLANLITSQGAVISISSYDNNRLKCDLSVSDEFLGKSFTLLSQAKGQVNLKIDLKAEKKITSFLVPKNELNAGLNTFTLFDESSKLLYELSYFLPPVQNIHLTWTNAQPEINTRSMNQFIFQLDTKSDQVSNAKLSARVYKKLAQGVNQQNISSHLMNASDNSFQSIVEVNGEIELANIEHPKFDIINGVATHNKSGMPLTDSVLILSVRANNGAIYTAKTEADGQFRFVIPKIHGEAQLYLSLRYGDINHFDINVSGKAFENYYHTKRRLSYAEASSAYYLHTLQSKYMASVFDSEDCKNIKRSHVKMETFSFDASYDLDEYHLPATVEEVIVDILSGVRVRNQKGRKVLSVLTKGEMISDKYTASLRGKPLLLIDGIYINDENVFLKLNPQTISTISLIYSEYFLGETSFAGVIAVETKTGLQHDNLSKDKTGVYFSYDGYFEFDPFDSPCSIIRDKTVPDFRYLLAWEPSLSSDGDGSFSFFVQTSDEEGDYMLDIQGITSAGTPFNKSFEFKVVFTK
jgi:hypothetical protein